MVICWNCHLEQYNGTIFCAECGAHMEPSRHPLHAIEAVACEAVAAGSGHALDNGIDNAIDIAMARTGGDAGRIADVAATPIYDMLLVRETADHVIELRLMPTEAQGFVIGRTDQKSGVVPDIDLDQYGARDAGVSRQHAVLHLGDDGCTIEDLGSVNGTYVNRHPVPPRHVVALHNGDELRLGAMRVRVAVGM